MMDILEEAKDVLHQEAQGIEKLIPTLNQNFVNAVNMIMKSKGRVIVTGMGKSGHIARKVSATLSSTGTPSIFLHPAEAIHGVPGKEPYVIHPTKCIKCGNCANTCRFGAVKIG